MTAAAAVAAGSILLKSVLPAGSDVDNLDSGKIEKLVSDIVRKDPENAHKYVSMLGKMFFDYATKNGYSVGLEDYENNFHERREILNNFERDVNRISDSSLSKERKRHEISRLAEDAKASLSTQNLSYLLKQHKTSALMAQTGARGNSGQLMQASASPLLGADSSGNPVPYPIRHSYAEGLSLGEMSAMAFGARHNTVMAQMSTSKPGAIFKWIAPNVFHEVISEADCGTRAGSIFPLADQKDTLYHVEAKTGTLVTPEYLHLLQRDGKKTVEVRTPLTCKAPSGICQKCYGYDSSMHFPSIGSNVGTQAAQSVSEQLTQSILSTKHTGGLAGKSRDAFSVTQNFLFNPANFLDEATLATQAGVVQSVSKTALKDHEVTINGIGHFVPSSQDVTVKAGDHIKKGQPLSTGMVNPAQLIQHKGLLHTRKYYSKTLRDVYNGSPEQSKKMNSLDPRHFDIIARNMVQYVRIEDPGETDLVPGEEVSVARLSKILMKNATEETLSQAAGKISAETGEKLTHEILDTLKEEGRSHVLVTHTKISVTPLVKGLRTNKFADPNWISKLSYNHIRDVISNAAAQGERAPLHGHDPVLPYLVGSEFGAGEKGEY